MKAFRGSSAPYLGGYVAILAALIGTIALAVIVSRLAEHRFRRRVHAVIMGSFNKVRPAQEAR